MEKQTLKDISISGKRVLARVDYNVPQDDAGKITDDARIVKSLDTVRYCLEQNASLVLMAHLGRPKGKRDPRFSLKPVAEHLSRLIGKPVAMLNDCIGSEVEAHVAAMKPGDVCLLENVRFYKEETENDAAFAEKLARLGDVYVNDAFGAAHRAHASTEGVARYLPAVAGFLLDREISYLSKATENPAKPFVTILGGAKVSDKIKLISNLLDKADCILIGGAMAYTFYKVQGIKIGNSKFEPEGEPAAREALEKAKVKGIPLELPVDRLIAEDMDKPETARIVEGDIPDNWSGFDIGPKSVERFKEILSKAKTVVWNGPVGLFEVDAFSKGTREIAAFLSGLDATTIIGGGDTAAAVRKYGYEEKMSHVSTGGGASLEFLEGTELPGVAALMDRKAAVK